VNAPLVLTVTDPFVGEVDAVYVSAELPGVAGAIVPATEPFELPEAVEVTVKVLDVVDAAPSEAAATGAATAITRQAVMPVPTRRCFMITRVGGR
jgi:hypothetical protein